MAEERADKKKSGKKEGLLLEAGHVAASVASAGWNVEKPLVSEEDVTRSTFCSRNRHMYK